MRAAELASDGQGISRLRSAGSSGAASASATTPSGVRHGDDSDDDPERELPQAGESGSDSEAEAAPGPEAVAAATPATPAAGTAAAAEAAVPLSVEAARAAALEKLGRSGIVLRHSRLLADVLTRGVRGVQAAADECAKEGRWF